MAIASITRMRTAEQAAERINGCLAKTVASIIETGRALTDEKAALEHGEWGRLFDDQLVPFSRQTAFRFMAIAQHPVISNVAHAQHLPPSWYTLYELTRVDDARLERALVDGTVTADSERKEIRALVRASADDRKRLKAAKGEAREFTLTAGKATTDPARRPYSVSEWESLSTADRDEVIASGFACRTGMNKQSSDAIEWAQHSLNTVTGCLHDCPYCYARDIAERYYPEKFAPTFRPDRLSAPSNTPLPKEARSDPAYRNIFANSMSDLFGQWVPTGWIEATIEMARRNPKWNFLTLTKFPIRAAEFTFPDNWWMGTTVDAQCRVDAAEKAFSRVHCKTKWLSVEPLLEPLTFRHLDRFEWMVIGGSSPSTKTPAWVPPFEWLVDLDQQAQRAGVRRYYKTNTLLPDDVRVREFPWHQPKVKKLPKAFRYLKGMS